jgi:molecular chaperone GrpE
MEATMTNPDQDDQQEPEEGVDSKAHADAMAQADAIIEEAIARNSANATDDGAIGDAEADEASADDALTEAEQKAAEHLEDLQRLQAEYVNYRKRVDRDRAAAGDVATARLIESLIPVLDDIAAAREHGDLTDGPFAAIADKLEDSLGRAGWSQFGEVGEVFDPARHEALLSQPSPDVTEPTVTTVAQPGHSIGDKVIRAARVIVSQPE